MSEKVQERIIAILAHEAGMEASDVKLDMSFEDLNLASIDIINVIFELEEEFDIEIPQEREERLYSVSALIEGVENLIKAQGQEAA